MLRTGLNLSLNLTKVFGEAGAFTNGFSAGFDVL